MDSTSTLKSKKPLIIVLIVLALLIIIGVVLTFTVFAKPIKIEITNSEAAEIQLTVNIPSSAFEDVSVVILKPSYNADNYYADNNDGIVDLRQIKLDKNGKSEAVIQFSDSESGEYTVIIGTSERTYSTTFKLDN